VTRDLRSPKTVKWIALLTVVMSIPLLLSFNIKIGLVPAGTALRFSLFLGTLECFRDTRSRTPRVRYNDSDLAFPGRIQ